MKHTLALLKVPFLALIFMFANQLSLSAQSSDEVIRCVAVEAEESRLDDKYQQYFNRFEKYIKQQSARLGGEAVNNYTIPVVFHIIHDNDAVGSGDNIATQYINSQLEQLNNDFRKIMGTSGDGGGVDTGIEFCMATVNENGNPLAVPGINRIDRNTQGWTAPPYGTPVFGCFLGANLDYINNTIKPQSQWDPEEYMNIWVMDMVCGILGFAQFPEAASLPGIGTGNGGANTDGVVVLTGSVGSTDNPLPGGASPFNQGRTLTHEVGHFFGLRHIWGDGDCSQDDFCADTPDASSSTSGCPANKDSCPGGGTDQIENYMDYSDDDCMERFTMDQTDRMQIVMGATGVGSPRREILASSPACGSAAPSFSINATNSPVTVTQPDDAVFNFSVGFNGGFSGSVTLSASGLPGGLNASFSTNPVNSAGSYTMTISGTGSVAAGTYNFSIDGTDGGTLSDSEPVSLIIEEEGSTDCNTFVSSNVPVSIPNQTTVTSTISVGTSGTVSDVNVAFDGDHTAVRDLIFELISPAGTTIQLVDLDDPCNRQNNFDLGFDDQATQTISNIPCPPNNGQFYQPEEALSTFNGEQGNGTWTLRITDDRNNNTGQLNGWSLEICFGNITPPTCDDGIQNGLETGVDCGGPDCPACPPTCDDGIQNGLETGVDCGGPDCPACPTCDDGIQNGLETGVDCGGPDCDPCMMETCDTPTGLFETNNTGNSITLNWSAVAAANNYTVQGRQAGTNNWQLTVNSNSNSTTISNNIVSGVTYEWRVRSNCTGENSPYSVIETFTAGSSAAAIEGRGETIDLAQLQVNIYPSPASQEVHIVSNYEIAQIEVVDITGKIVRVLEFTDSNVLRTRIDVNAMSAGHYFVRIRANDSVEILRFVKE